jgi:2-polyprenyl-3-methyl-5-hydroxy-6-metoxy-1,4-benzoquinol methylase
MDNSVKHFYHKENNPEYYKKYAMEHAPRFDFLEQIFHFSKINFKAVADFGCGAGILLNRLNDSNIKYGFDGADLTNIPIKFHFYCVDFENPFINRLRSHNEFLINNPYSDISFCFETLEHIGNPYNLLCEIKNMTKVRGDIYISIPDVRMTHIVPYPALIYPHQNFEQFLEQMACPIQEAVYLTEVGRLEFTNVKMPLGVKKY